MQKVKRKSEEVLGTPKKKKFNNSKIDCLGAGDQKKPDYVEKKSKKKLGSKTSPGENDLPTKKNNNKAINDKTKKIGDKTKKPFIINKKFGDKKDGFKGKFGKPGQGKPSANTTSEKPVWSEMKKEKKELRIVRRKAKATAEVFEISVKAKLLGAQIQRKTVNATLREDSCKELHSTLKGQYKSIALSHDLSRVIQVLLKHSTVEIKTEITEELLDIIVPMAQSKYGHHAVKRILKYGSDTIRHKVIKGFLGHILSLASHNISAPVLDYAYGEFANNKEKCHMQQEFYGEIYRNTKDNKVKSLKDCYSSSPEMKPAILSSCKANIQKLLDKNLHDGELLHAVLYDYMRECSPEQKAELITTLSPLIVPLSNSLPGVNAASICVWQATNKDKKTILKVVKEHVIPLSKHKTGYRLLIAIFDSVDDTVLVKKTIVSTIAANITDIAKDHWGNMTLHWLVKPKDPAAFHPTFTKFLEAGAKSGTSKKDANIRVSELREAILPLLKKDIEETPEAWLSGKARMLLVVTVLSIESSKEMVTALARVICKSDWRVKDNKGTEYLAVEEAGIHMCLKKLAHQDKDRQDGTLGEAVAEFLDKDTITVWLPTNRGCFFLLKLIEANIDTEVASKLTTILKPHASMLKQQTTEGAKLLLKIVQNK